MVVYQAFPNPRSGLEKGFQTSYAGSIPVIGSNPTNAADT